MNTIETITAAATYQPAIADAMKPNLSDHTDKQQQVVASRHLLRAGGL